jgi:multicomponent Na+:H+ antiporter subunit A
MAGVPPLLGFASKEAAVEAVLKLKGFEAFIVGAAIFGGSALTVAYTLRFLIGVFGSSGPRLPGGADSAEELEPTPVAGPILGMAIPAALLALAGLVGFFTIGFVNDIVIPAAAELHPEAGEFKLYRWPGFTTGFVISMLIVGSGTVIGLIAARLPTSVPDTVGANRADGFIDGLLVVCRAVAARVQHGSMPVYLATMGTAMVVASLPFVSGLEFSHLVLWDNPLQGFLAAAVVASAFAGAFVGSRLGAALSLGAVGIGVSGLFFVHGAPDLALTQLLVETVIVVGFVIGLGHLASRFPGSAGTWKTVRLGLAALGGLAVMAGLTAAGVSPTGQAPIDQLAGPAAEEGGGDNIVNVILTDVRALDTFGEVVVLATAAIGVLALARASRPARPGTEVTP